MPSKRTQVESAALKAAIVREYTTTDSNMRVIARRFCIDPAYVRRTLIANNVTPEIRPSARWTDLDRIERDRQICELYASDVSVAEIASRFNLANTAPSRIVRNRGLPTRRPYISRASLAAANLVRDTRIVDAANAGQTQASSAAHFGLSRIRIAQILRKAREESHRVALAGRSEHRDCP